MKHTIFFAVAISCMALFGIFSIRLLSPEDSWVCVNNVWEKHGNPGTPQPLTGCGTVSPSTIPTTSENNATIIQTITDQLGKKYSRPDSDFTVTVSESSGGFAKGSVSIKNEMGGALWFAAKTSTGWELASDGQGPMSCDIADKYHFPNTLVPGCVDTANNNTFIKR